MKHNLFSEYSKLGQPVPILTYTFRLLPKQDLMSELNKFMLQQHITAASIITAVGSVEQALLRFANQPQFTKLPDGYYEIVSLVGTLGSGESHIHGAFADKNGKTYGGHIRGGCIIYTTAEITIGIHQNLQFTREIAETGYKELVVKCEPSKNIK